MANDYNSPFLKGDGKAIYGPAKNDSDLTFEGGPAYAEFDINGFKPVTVVGDGELPGFLKNPA